MCGKISLIIFVVIFTLTNGAKILGIIPTPSYSHQIVYQGIWKELSLRGHQITLLTTDPQNDPSLTNLSEIDLHFSYDMWSEVVIKMKKSALDGVDIYYTSMCNITDYQLQHPKVQNIIRNETEHFDLILVEFFLPIMFAFKDRFNCPLIGMISMEALTGAYKYMGNPSHPVVHPDFILPFATPLNFVQRVISVVTVIIMHRYFLHYNPLMQSVIDKHFVNQNSDVINLMQNIDLMFINTNPILYPVRPLIPSIIQIGGGIHLKPPKQLPKNFQEFLDSAKEGVIYFSLGTNAKSEDLSEEIINILLRTFSELPYKVLWKFEETDLLHKPDNVMISQWFPQQDILRHPNIKLFISQCGAQSTEEALINKIPILGIPMLADQGANVERIVMKGMGLSISLASMTKESLSSAIVELIENPKYKTRLIELAELLLDQPMTGLEKAIWWTEYVIRHKGAKHLKSRPIHTISFIDYYLLDVIGFCILVIGIACVLLFIAIRLLYKLLRKALIRKSKTE